MPSMSSYVLTYATKTVVPCITHRHPKPQFSSNMSCSLGHGKSQASFKTASISASYEETRVEKDQLLQQGLMPKHLAIIMDGNRRWAVVNDLPASEGYKAGLRKVTETLQICNELGVETVSVFMFSSENWKRSKEEVNILMSLYEEYVASLAENATQHNVRFAAIGDVSMLPKSFRRQIKETETATRSNRGVQFAMAVSYGGRQEIIGAAKEIAAKVNAGEISVGEINNELFERELQTKGVQYPCPDLLIRTSGEKRLSNFFLWQMAYTELHFVDKCFPDLEEDDIVKAVVSFQRRHRRFGV